MSNAIVKNIQRRAKVAQKRRELKEEAQNLKCKSAQVNREFIAEQLKKFLKSMENKWNLKMYANGEFNKFTHFVNRYAIPINREHDLAMQKFNLAKEELAKVFVEGLQENKNGERDKIINNSGIKNIKEMEFHFRKE